MSAQESLLERLVSADVEFIVVGGFAAVTHGASLLTQDLDICCRFCVEGLLRLQDALKGLRPVHRPASRGFPLNLDKNSCRGLKNLYLQTDLGPLDCLSEILGLGDYEEVLAQSTDIQLPFGCCRVLTLDALIKSKGAMNRPQDKLVLAQLRAIRQETSGGHE